MQASRALWESIDFFIFIFFLAVALIVADNDPKAAQRFADDTTVSDSLSLGEGVGGGELFSVFWLVVHMTSDRNSYVRSAERALDREVQNLAPLSPRRSLPVTA